MKWLDKLKKFFKNHSWDNNSYYSDPYGSDELDDPSWDSESY